MNFALLLPAGLAALAALTLPLLIHLRRRSQQQRVDFAALRWLAAQELPRRRARLEEWPLLTLRLLLLTLLALLLAAPVLFDGADRHPWVVVVPGVDPASLPAPAASDAPWRWLAPGFPELTHTPAPPAEAIASLLRELDAHLDHAVPLTVIVPPHLRGLDGERIALSREVQWRIAAALPPPARKAEAAPEPILIALRHADDAEHLAQQRWLDATTHAWNRAMPADTGAEAPFRIERASTEGAVARNATWLIWLSDAPLPQAWRDWVDAGGTALLIGAKQALPANTGVRQWRSASTEVELRAVRQGAGRLLVLPVALQPGALPELLEPEFPDLLREWLAPEPPAPQWAPAQTQVPQRGVPPWPAPGRPLDSTLQWVIAGLWLLERWLATRAVRMAAA
jgi:hypothetical protein